MLDPVDPADPHLGERIRFRFAEPPAPPEFKPEPPAPRWRHVLARLPWWWSALLFAAAATGLAQTGFRLLGLHSTLLFVLGLLCLLAAVWAAFRAGFTIIKGLGT